jgi:hypothetical protein
LKSPGAETGARDGGYVGSGNSVSKPGRGTNWESPESPDQIAEIARIREAMRSSVDGSESANWKIPKQWTSGAKHSEVVGSQRQADHPAASSVSPGNSGNDWAGANRYDSVGTKKAKGALKGGAATAELKAGLNIGKETNSFWLDARKYDRR